MPSVQSNYIAMDPMMADKADPNKVLSVTVVAGHFCRFVGRKCAVSRLA